MKGNIIYKKTIPEKASIYAEFPSNLHPDIQSFLVKQNIQSLYPMRRKTPCFSYGDVRRVHRIYASN